MSHTFNAPGGAVTFRPLAESEVRSVRRESQTDPDMRSIKATGTDRFISALIARSVVSPADSEDLLALFVNEPGRITALAEAIAAVSWPHEEG